MKRPKIDVINESHHVTDADVRRAVKALQKQVREHFAPIWGLDAELRFAGRSERATSHAWQLVLLDEPSVDDGYHELTKVGNPLGKVFVKVALDDSGGWTSTASHELLELLADPDMSRGIFVETNSGPRVYAYEICDPCQDDAHAYRIDGELVSDFVYPAWFDFFRLWPEPKDSSGAKRAVRFDYTGKVAAPYEVVAGGYVSFYDVHARAWKTRGPGKAGRISVWGGIGGRGSVDALGIPERRASVRGEAAGSAHPERTTDDPRTDATVELEEPEHDGARPGGSRRMRRHLPRSAWRPSER